VRELLHVVESAAVLCEGPELLAEHLPAALRVPAPPGLSEPPSPEPLPTLRELERIHIARALEVTAGHRARAAGILGISERSLYRKIEEYQLSRETG